MSGGTASILTIWSLELDNLSMVHLNNHNLLLSTRITFVLGNKKELLIALTLVEELPSILFSPLKTELQGF